MVMGFNGSKAAIGNKDVLGDPSAKGGKNGNGGGKEGPGRTCLVKKEKVEVETNCGGMFILPPKTMGE